MDILALLLSIILGFVPMFICAYFIYWLDRYEKEPVLLLLGVFIWGAVVAAGAAFTINTLLGVGVYVFTNSESAADLATGSLIAPVVEESLKGFAVLLVFFIFRRDFDSILDGIVYAAIAALGFAATENAYYIYTYGFQEGQFGGLLSMAFVRVFLVGWQHPFYTAFIGIGLAVTRLSRNISVILVAPILGWLAAVVSHSLHNTLASLLPDGPSLLMTTSLDWTGWSFMFVAILLALYQEQKWINRYLQEELTMGLISLPQYKTACSAWSQTFARMGAFFSGKYLATDRFYLVCGELAQKKHQLAVLGDEGDNTAMIARLRSELARLALKADTF